jgi:CBS domain-containing protein
MFPRSDNKIRQLTVVVEGRLVGIITADDLLKFNPKRKSIELEELENHIMDKTGGSG